MASYFAVMMMVMMVVMMIITMGISVIYIVKIGVMLIQMLEMFINLP